MAAGWFYPLTGVWGIVMVTILIRAIRLSYRVEARSPDLRNRTGLPRRAAWVQVMINHGVARDPETQALRRRMNLLLLLIVAGFLLLWAGLVAVGRVG
jgi:hypothetical protein